ncbi:uncharacterized protein LOC118194673 isoform X2 [Stegodyphus dumicola]|uniref:uncharacterized protein LOC118194673 isoform X2 n=1 Tax=Stegodyphus dumicola TaxID=202533 RepID=UPI0015A7B453|nr:uncharacterized protein LOC118194673 isoform X2 [Stegodyphus dumicola]
MSTAEAKPHLQYGRDYLLQLRMHPLSIQRPKKLADFEMAKEKINSTAMFPNKNLPTNVSSDILHSFVNLENSKNILRQRRTLTSYFPKYYPLYPSSQTGSATSQNVLSSKYRYTSLPDYPLRKHSLPSSSLYKNDVSASGMYYGNSHLLGPWSKHFYPLGNAWNSHSEMLHNRAVENKEVVEHMSKSKKKLPIIDPRTGKNVLEAVNKFSSPPQDKELPDENVVAETRNAKSSETTFNENHYCNAETDIRNFYDKIDVDYINAANSPQACNESSFIIASNNIMRNLNASLFNSSDEEIKETVPETVDANVNENSLANKNFEMYHEIGLPSNSKDNTEQTFIGSFTYENDAKSLYLNAEKSNSDDDRRKSMANDLLHDLCENVKGTNGTSNMQNLGTPQYRRQCHSFVTKSHSKNFEDELNENVTLLREKVYLMRQEQQKMAILHSFLRYKKHQLDEYAHKLDDKKLELANWEFTLNAVHKKLKDKEYWIEAKWEILKNREQQIEEREKVLKKSENVFYRDFNNHYREQEILLKKLQEQSDIKKEFNSTEKPKDKICVNSEFGEPNPEDEQDNITTKPELNNFSEKLQNIKLHNVKMPLEHNENRSHYIHRYEHSSPESSQQVDYKSDDSDTIQNAEDKHETCPDIASENDDLNYNLIESHKINTDLTMLQLIEFSGNKNDSHGKFQHPERKHEVNSDLTSAAEPAEPNLCIINEIHSCRLAQCKTYCIAEKENSELNELGPLQKKIECTCKSGIESEGRQYLPEHIKFWLKKKESVLQNNC